MKVLLVGNTGYVTEEFVEEAFPECQVMVLGNKMIKTVRRRELISRPFPRTELELGDISEHTNLKLWYTFLII